MSGSCIRWGLEWFDAPGILPTSIVLCNWKYLVIPTFKKAKSGFGIWVQFLRLSKKVFHFLLSRCLCSPKVPGFPLEIPRALPRAPKGSPRAT